MKEALIIFIKNPIIGKVKTRLAATTGDEAAFHIYHQLLRHTLQTAEKLSCDKYIYYSDFIEGNDIWNDDLFFKKVQHGNHLGERMCNAFEAVFFKACNKAVIIGSDCMELSSSVIENAFAALDYHDIVLGPATDGGYYLLGMKKIYPFLFQNISWSTASVFDTTISLLQKNSLSYFLLPVLTDIDEEKDWVQFQSKLPYAKK